VGAKYINEWEKMDDFELYQGLNKLNIDVISQCVFGLLDEELVMDCKQEDGTFVKATLGHMVQLGFKNMILKCFSPLRIFSNFFDDLVVG